MALQKLVLFFSLLASSVVFAPVILAQEDSSYTDLPLTPSEPPNSPSQPGNSAHPPLHGNVTRPPPPPHGKESFPHPPHDNPPHHKPPHDEPPHDKPPHHEPSHDKPPHHKPPHHEPSHDKPPHHKPPHQKSDQSAVLSAPVILARDNSNFADLELTISTDDNSTAAAQPVWTQSHNLIIGVRLPGDRLLRQVPVKAPPRIWPWEQNFLRVTVTTTRNVRLTKINAVDLTHDGTNAYVTLQEGGIGQTFAVLQFKRNGNYGIHFLLSLYGR